MVDSSPSGSSKIVNEEIEESKEKKKDLDDVKLKPVHFHCEICGLDELCDYFGNKPDFVNKIQFLEDCYVMRDPFSPPPSRNKSKPEYFLVLGSHCDICKKSVCKSSECSFFYTKTFCLQCASNYIKRFPIEVQAKFKKQLASIE